MSTLVEKEVHRQLLRLLPSILASKKPAPKIWRVAATTHFFVAELASVAVAWGITTNSLFLQISGKEAVWTTTDVTTIALALAWTLFVVCMKKYKVAERMTLGESCSVAFRSFEDELHGILRQDEYPPRALVALGPRIEEALRLHRGGLFVNPNGPDIHLEAKAQAKALVARFKDLWRDEIGRSDSGGPG